MIAALRSMRESPGERLLKPRNSFVKKHADTIVQAPKIARANSSSQGQSVHRYWNPMPV
jgi:hypothetical protein